ncbi:MAG: LuxR C-terminal-related transcriptional regulator [Actinomycetota bacterium]
MEFVSQVPKRDLELLSELSLLDSFTIDDANKISSHPDSKRRINLLEQKRCLSVISEAPNRYQISSLIRDELRSLLANNAENFKDIALKSAEALKDKYPLKALELYALAGNVESATKLLKSNLQHFLLSADMELVLKWAPFVSMALGGGINREKLVRAYGLLGTGKFEQVKSTLREIESGLATSKESEVIANDIAPLKLYLEFFSGNFERVISDYQSVNYNSQNESFVHRAILLSHFYTLDSANYLQYYEAKRISSFVPSAPIDQVYVNSFKAMGAFLTGKYLHANEYALASCQIAEELGVEGSYFPFEAAFILMDTSLEFGDDEKSQEYVDKYLPKAVRYSQFPWIAALYSKAALISAQSGEIHNALLLLKKGRDAVDSPLFNSAITFILDSHELIVRLPLGDMERINELLFRLSQTDSVKSFQIALEIMRNPAQAETLSKGMLCKTDQDVFRRELMLATALVDNKRKALKHLERAVSIAVPNGYFRAFFNLPPSVKNLLLDLAASSPTIYLENLSKAIRAQKINLTVGGSSLDQPLTKKELIILRRLESGLPLTQIASDLSISKNTIKTHLKNIYRKLDSDSRHEAVIKAKELMLL